MSVSDAIADVIKHILDKIEKAIGFVYDPNGRKKEAENQLIKRAKENNLLPLYEAEIIRNAGKIIKYYNQNDILKLALENLHFRDLPNNDDIDKIDDEWLSRFFDNAKHVSSDEMKWIWARILSNELSNPGSIPKRVITILSMIERQQAELFTKLCQHTVYFDDLCVPIIGDDFKKEYLMENEMCYALFLDLESLGLISFNTATKNQVPLPTDQSNKGILFEQTYKFFNHTFVINFKNISDNDIEVNLDVGNFIFTNCGEALMHAIDLDYSDEACKYIVEYFENQGYKVYEKNKIQNITIKLKHSIYKASAGHGFNLNNEDDWEEIEVPDTPEARRADFSLTISGDSMEPIYSDGEIVLVKSQPAVNIGETGIFIVNGSGFIKKNGGDRLISLNPEYDDITFCDGDTVSCVGRVIGKA